MTIALVLRRRWRSSGPTRSSKRELPRRALRFGAARWPRATGVLRSSSRSSPSCTLPQLIVISIQLHDVGQLFGFHVRTHRPRADAAVLRRVLRRRSGGARRAKNARQLYLFSAYVLGALATLAKGPAGIALPGDRARRLPRRRRPLARHLSQARAPARRRALHRRRRCPWYHAMLIRHGAPLLERVHRRQLRAPRRRAATAIAAPSSTTCSSSATACSRGRASPRVGAALGFGKLREKSPRAQLSGFALVWFLVEFATVTLVNTKFHHYILPALPALAILAALFLDDFLRAPSQSAAVGAWRCSALPLTFLSGRDLSAFPPRLLWMFNYDYVNAPGTGRPWPLVDAIRRSLRVRISDPRLRHRGDARRRRAHAGRLADAQRARRRGARARRSTRAIRAASRWRWRALFVVALGVGIALGPASPNGSAPVDQSLAWCCRRW